MFSDSFVLWLTWDLLPAGCLLAGLALMPKSLLLWSGKFISPNHLSIIHTPFALVGYFWFYLQGDLFWGLQLIIVGAALDRLDGRLARLLNNNLERDGPWKDFWVQLHHKGGTPLGEVLDPLMDKMAALPVYAHICGVFIYTAFTSTSWLATCVLCLGALMIIIMIFVEVTGQLVRNEYFSKYRVQRTNRANWAGKAKAVLQWVWLLPFVPWHQDWVTTDWYVGILVAFLAIILSLAVISLRRKADVWMMIRDIQKAVARCMCRQN